ncbi:hypothetical protein B0H13DRAFT_1623474, partial [Mycena leptocephala]
KGVQRRVDAFFAWCRKNLVISVIKTKWMLFGPLPRILPTIYVGLVPIELVHEYKYVGVWFSSTTRQILSKHYSVKASKARSVSYATFSVESFVGVLPPREALLLYKARVDPHLISGCEVSLDVDRTLGATLETPQTHHLRRLLSLNPRLMLAVLFTETGIMPIRYRRAILALGYAKGFTRTPEDAIDLPRAAFREFLRLAERGHSCWGGDLHWVLASLPIPSEITTLLKTQFLKNRLEVDDSGKLTTITLRFRHYLRLVSAPHRIAYTRFLLSDHRLAVEGLRHGNRVWRYAERELRLCRICRAAAEDECHAFLQCTGHPALTGFRASFLRDLFSLRPEFRAQVQTASAYDFLISIVHCRDVTKCLARFVYDVFTVFEQKEMLIPPSHFIHGGDR